MTKLIVKPIDPNAPGSFRERQRLFNAIEQLDGVSSSENIGAAVRAYNGVLAIIMPRLYTDDDTPVEEALDELSASQFDALLASVGGQAETVPPASASS